MRFKQYLTEGNKLPVETVLTMVYDKSKPFIKDLVKGGFSYYNKQDSLMMSGRKGYDPTITKKVRQDRSSKDTPEDTHKLMDNEFNKKFGIKARSQTIFCTGDLHTARGYGSTVYLIFPIGKYEIIWSPKYRDLYNDTNSIFYNPMKDLEKSEIKIWREWGENGKNDKEREDAEFKKASDTYNKRMDSISKEVVSSYQKDNIVQALRSTNEIMLYTKQYIGFRRNDWDFILKSYIDKFGVKYPTKENIEKWFELYGSPDMSYEDLF